MLGTSDFVMDEDIDALIKHDTDRDKRISKDEMYEAIKKAQASCNFCGSGEVENK